MRVTLWISCGLALSGIVGTLLHAQISEADKKKRDAFLKAREEMHTIASPTPSESPKPSGKPKVSSKKAKKKKARNDSGRRGDSGGQEKERCFSYPDSEAEEAGGGR